MTSGWPSTSRMDRTGRPCAGFWNAPIFGPGSVTGHLRSSAQLSEALGEWVSRCGAHTAMHHLQRAGLAAGVVQDMADLWRDPQLRARGILDPVWQQDLGCITYTGSAQRWTQVAGASPSAAGPPR